jgi:hypothetical protein
MRTATVAPCRANCRARDTPRQPARQSEPAEDVTASRRGRITLMPVATPSAAELVPVAPMSARLVADIIEARAAGQSARSIAAERDLGLRRA